MRDHEELKMIETKDASRAMIYMDHNGSTPTHPDAIRAMMPFLTEGFGNPSSGHWAADTAKDAIESSRKCVAKLLGANPSEIVLTSGATEANNMVIKGLLPKVGARAQHVITSAIEHDAVLKPIRALRKQGVKFTVLPVNQYGIIDPKAVEAAITEDTNLISIMMANNEVGSVQPTAEIGAIARKYDVPFHTDAAQAVGKIPVDVRDLKVDFMSLAGHKFGAPNGIGALFVRNGLSLSPLMNGGRHENGRRAGTESALLAAGLGAAALVATEKDQSQLRALRDYFWDALQEAFGKSVALNGNLISCVPNTLSVSFLGHIGADILAKMPNVAATTGSACHAGCVDMSHVLLAMGKSVEIGMGTIRFSLGSQNSYLEVDEVVASLRRVLN